MLLLVRHGQTPLNADRRMQGRSDPGLDDLGVRQAEAIADRLGGVDRVITSPMRRTMETARLLGEPMVDDRWLEQDFGELEGQPIAEVVPELMEAMRRGEDVTPPGGESGASVRNRVSAACDDLAVEAAERNIVVVTHVGPLKAALGWALGIDRTLGFRTHVDVASISRVAFRREAPILVSFNEVDHLPPAERGPWWAEAGSA